MFHCACRAARHRIHHERKAVRSRLAYKMEHERVPVLVTEYAPGAGIGWHRDRPEFRDAPFGCLFRLGWLA